MNDEEIKKGIEDICKALCGEEKKYWYEKQLLLNHEEIMDTFFVSIISKFEGTCCCVDKAHFIRRRCINAINDKQDYSLQETYKDYHNRGGDLGGISLEKSGDKICYWCPKIFKDTEEAIRLYRLYIEFSLDAFNHLLQILVERTKEETNNGKIN